MLSRKSDCSGEDLYNIDAALVDEDRPTLYNIGLMNCYCDQMYKLYDDAALKIIFYDGEQYCKDWYNAYDLSKYTGIGVGCWIAFMNIINTLTF